jgi:uncharacterized protein (TIGR03382 family)
MAPRTQALLYVFAAALFAVAAALNAYNEGFSAQTGLGALMALAMLTLGWQARRG